MPPDWDVALVGVHGGGEIVASHFSHLDTSGLGVEVARHRLGNYRDVGHVWSGQEAVWHAR